MTDRHAIGGNSPPPLEAFGMEIEELFSLVSGSVASPITSDEQEAALDGLLDDVRKVRKDADAQRAAEKAPHLEASRKVDADWKPHLERCDKATAALKDALTPWRTAKQRAAEDAARKLREEAEESERQAQAALRASDDLEARFAAEEQLKAADRLAKVANRIDRAPTGLRTTQIADVTDHKALLLHVMRTDPDALTDWLAAYAQRALPAQLPGVTIRIEKRAA